MTVSQSSLMTVTGLAAAASFSSHSRRAAAAFSNVRLISASLPTASAKLPLPLTTLTEMRARPAFSRAANR